MKLARFQGFGYREYFPSGAYVGLSSDNHNTFCIGLNTHINIDNEIRITNTHSTNAGVAICMPGNGQPNQGGMYFFTKPPTGGTAGDVAYDLDTSTPSMMINGSGKVGIGTRSPAGILDVKHPNWTRNPTASTLGDILNLMTSSSGETGKNNMRTLLCFADGYNNSSAQNVYDTYRVRMRMSGAGWDMIWKSSGTNSTITETIATNTTDNNFIFARDYTSFMNKNVGIGTTNPTYKLELSGSGQSWTTAPVMAFHDTYNAKSWIVGNANANTAGDFYIRRSVSTMHGIRITQGGAMYVYGNVYQPSTSLGSDDRLKHNEKDITSALETINKLKVQRYFKTNTLYDASHQFELDNSGNPITDEEYYDEIGIIAQDIKKIPELAFCVGGKEEEEKIKTHYKKDVSGNFILDVSGNKIVDFEETINIKTPLYLNYNNIFCYHIQATQELDKQQQADKLKIQTLETTIQQQATKITTLETQIADILTRLSNLENREDLVSKLNELKELAMADELIQQTAETIMTLDTVNRIDTLRQKLGQIDFMLADVNNLVTSFINYQTRPATQEQPPQPTQEELPAQSLHDLQDKIDLFRKNLADEPPADNEVTS